MNSVHQQANEGRKSLALGTRVSFAAGNNIGELLLDGWSAQEHGHRWTDGYTARMGLLVDGIGSNDVLIRIRCKAFAPSANVDYQRVEVRVNCRRVGVWIVRAFDWYEVGIENSLVRTGKIELELRIGRPASPKERGISEDTRKLGLFVTHAEVIPSPYLAILDWIGAGADPMGRVLYKGGNYYRAIWSGALDHVETLRNAGVFDALASRRLVPPHTFASISHSQYSLIAMTPGADWEVFPGYYVFRELMDAALVWLEINEYLLSCIPGQCYGLVDGHYGNFALFENSRPMWVDSGSIVRIDNQGTEDGWFGIDQFVICFVYPLVAIAKNPMRLSAIRDLMSRYPDGISHQNIHLLVDERLRFQFGGARDLARRASVIGELKVVLSRLEYKEVHSAWAGYRNEEALRLALLGHYLQDSEDPRFRAVMSLTRRSKAKTFVDVGANDGIFSIMCAREGLRGLVTDVDDDALNRLYKFLSQHQDLSLSVGFAPFTHVECLADLVLALALTHHLVLSQGVSFLAIAAKLASITRHAVVTEFMPDGLGGTPGFPEPSPNPLPESYSLDEFLVALRTHFDLVEVVDYLRPNPPSRRVLIYCEKRGV